MSSIWDTHDDQGNVVESITTEEWKRRFAARLMEAGMDERAAITAARQAYREALDDFRSNSVDGLIDPVEAAEHEISEWDDVGCATESAA